MNDLFGWLYLALAVFATAVGVATDNSHLITQALVLVVLSDLRAMRVERQRDLR